MLVITLIRFDFFENINLIYYWCASKYYITQTEKLKFKNFINEVR